MQPLEITLGQQVGQWIFILVPVLVFLVGVLFAWRNLRMRRGDTRGALRVAAFLLCCSLLRWAAFAHHVPMRSEYDGSTWALSAALFLAAVFWVIYVAAEPYIRRRWPQSLISWSRLVAGGFRDPLVGAHMLLGIVISIWFVLLSSVPYYWLRISGAINNFAQSSALDGVRRPIGLILNCVPVSIYYSLIVLFFFFLLRALFRREWIAAPVVILLGAMLAGSSLHPVVDGVTNALGFALVVLVLIRFGVLPTTVLFFAYFLLGAFPMTADFSAWYAGISLAITLLILAMAAFAFHSALGGRKLFQEGFLES